MLTPEQLCERVLPILKKNGFNVGQYPQEWLLEVVTICQEKIPTLNHIVAYTDFFFVRPENYEEKGVRKFFSKPESGLWLQSAIEAMEKVANWKHDEIKVSYETFVSEEIKIGSLVNSTRLALTGKTVGPGLYELTELLGREEALSRMKQALEYIETHAGEAE